MPVKKRISKSENRKYKTFDKGLLGVKIMSVFHYINAGFWAIFGLLIIIFSKAVTSYLMSGVANQVSELSTVDSSLVASILILAGIFSIGVGVLNFFVAKGLWELKNWARIISIILAALVIVSTLYSIIGSFSWINFMRILIRAPIIVYLIFCKEAGKAFNAPKK